MCSCDIGGCDRFPWTYAELVRGIELAAWAHGYPAAAKITDYESALVAVDWMNERGLNPGQCGEPLLLFAEARGDR